jgi:hypothetical protein
VWTLRAERELEGMMHWRRIKGRFGGCAFFAPTRHGDLSITVERGVITLNGRNAKRLRDVADEFLRHEKAKAAEKAKARREREARLPAAPV